jgi:hypothetical protein
MNQFVIDGKRIKTNLEKQLIDTLYQMWQIRGELGLMKKNFIQFVKEKHPDCIIVEEKKVLTY